MSLINHVNIVLRVMVICSLHLWEGLLLLICKIKQFESEDVTLLSASPLPPPLRGLRRPLL